MGLAGLLLGVINVAIVLAVLVLIGAIIAWVANVFQWPIPGNVQRLYLLIVLLIGIYMLAALLLGMPVVHIVGKYSTLAHLLA